MMNIKDEIIECGRREASYEELRNHYARLARREKKRRIALQSFPDNEEAPRGAEGEVREVKRDAGSVPQGGGQGKLDLAADFEAQLVIIMDTL